MKRAISRLLLAMGLLSCERPAKDENFVPASDARVLVMGRVDRSGEGRLRFGFPGVTVRLAVEGPSLGMRVASTSKDSRLAIFVDGVEARQVRLDKGRHDVVLAERLPAGRHTIEIVHRTEAWQGIVSVDGFLLAPGGHLHAPKPFPERRLLFIGDSVTSGEAIDRPTRCSDDKAAFSNAYLSYGMLLGRALDAQVHLVSYGGRGLIRDWQGKRDVLNAPEFFDLAVPDPKAKVPWDHAFYPADLVLVSLGTNDTNLALGALPGEEEFVSAYVAFVKRIRARYPGAQILLTEGAMVNDTADPKRPRKSILQKYIAETVRRVGDERLQAVSSTNYPGDACDAHPTREQHAAMARDFEPVMRKTMGWN